MKKSILIMFISIFSLLLVGCDKNSSESDIIRLIPMEWDATNSVINQQGNALYFYGNILKGEREYRITAQNERNLEAKSDDGGLLKWEFIKDRTSTGDDQYGHITTYYPNGYKENIYHITTDSLEGSENQIFELAGCRIGYHENGNIKLFSTYHDSNPIGLWIYYTEDGEVDRVLYYSLENSELIFDSENNINEMDAIDYKLALKDNSLNCEDLKYGNRNYFIIYREKIGGLELLKNNLKICEKAKDVAEIIGDFDGDDSVKNLYLGLFDRFILFINEMIKDYSGQESDIDEYQNALYAEEDIEEWSKVTELFWENHL